MKVLFYLLLFVGIGNLIVGFGKLSDTSVETSSSMGSIFMGLIFIVAGVIAKNKVKKDKDELDNFNK